MGFVLVILAVVILLASSGSAASPERFEGETLDVSNDEQQGGARSRSKDIDDDETATAGTEGNEECVTLEPMEPSPPKGGTGMHCTPGGNLLEPEGVDISDENNTTMSELLKSLVDEEVEDNPSGANAVVSLELLSALPATQEVLAEMPKLLEECDTGPEATSSAIVVPAIQGRDRSELSQEFLAEFSDGNLGCKLEMDANKGCKITNIVEGGQAFIAGIMEGDHVIGVNEHIAASYGTILAFMNIVGQPVVLRIRKGEAYDSAGVVRSDYSYCPEEIPITAQTPRSKSRMTSTPKRKSSFTNLLRLSSNQSAMSTPGQVPSTPLSASKARRMSELADPDAPFDVKMSKGTLVTKYSQKGSAGLRVIFFDPDIDSLAWCDVLSHSNSGRKHRHTPSLAGVLKKDRKAYALTSLMKVQPGDEQDPESPGEKGTEGLRRVTGGDEAVLRRSFALIFKERNVEITVNSPNEMHQLVKGFDRLRQSATSS